MKPFFNMKIGGLRHREGLKVVNILRSTSDVSIYMRKTFYSNIV